jgi:hypothetical protein
MNTGMSVLDELEAPGPVIRLDFLIIIQVNRIYRTVFGQNHEALSKKLLGDSR